MKVLRVSDARKECGAWQPVPGQEWPGEFNLEDIQALLDDSGEDAALVWIEGQAEPVLFEAAGV